MTSDELINKLMANMDESWESSEGSAESMLVEYVRALELRVALLGGHTKAYDGGVHSALGTFYSVARLHVLSDSVDDWNGLVDAWDEYVRVKEEEE